jgi:endo-1,4-beta-xylanase
MTIKIIRLVNELRAKGIPVHGIGMQVHWAINEPSQNQLEQTLLDFSRLNLNIQITEMDISVYPKEHNARESKPGDELTEFTPEKEQQQSAVYKYCFALFRKYKRHISSVTFWNISDRHSWLDNFPVKNRKDYPLLFDKDLKPKNAFWEVVKF